MKKYAGKILLLLLAVVLIAALAACDNTTDTGGGNGGGERPDPATHTVHFDAGEGDPLGNDFDVTVTHGGTVESPKLNNGEPLRPTRLGYTFTGWVDEDGDDFIFSDTAGEGETPTVVNNDVTVSATWTPNTYTHTLVTSDNCADYPYDGDEANGGWTYPDDGSTVPDGSTVTVPDGEDGKAPSFVTIYGTKEASGDIPVAVSSDEDDWMVYWYYVTVEKDADGNNVVTEVPFTTSRTSKGDTSALKLLGNFTQTSELVLYPKMHSQLTDVTLSFDGGEDGSSEYVAKVGDKVAADAVDDPTREGYTFEGWYFKVTTGEGDDKETTEYKFIFVVTDEDGKDNYDDATKLSEEIAAADENGKLSISLYAKWLRTATITDASDLSEFATGLSDALAGEDEGEKFAYLNAEITFAENAVISVDNFAPLFSEDAPFAGTLTGNGATVTLNYNDTYDGSVYALIGANAGSISGITVNVNVTAAGAGKNVSIGAVGVNSGTLKDVTASLTVKGADGAALDFADATVYAGAIAARNAGGSITDCTVTAADISVTGAKTAYIGGAVGAAETSAVTAENVTVVAFSASVSASEARVGGFFGTAYRPEISKSGVKSADISVTAGTAYIGGFAGKNEGGSYAQCFTDATLTASVSSSLKAGGFAGESLSLISNCRAGAEIKVTAQAGAKEIFVGGIAGDARRTSTAASGESSSTGDINASFGGGSITVDAGEGAVTVYAGGVAGRMATMRSERSFADVDISVTGNNVTAHADAFVGATVNTVTFSKCYCASDATVTVKGEAVSLATRSGVTGIESAKFSEESWLTGNDNFNLDASVWEATPDGPRLVVESAPDEDDTTEEETPAEE